MLIKKFSPLRWLKKCKTILPKHICCCRLFVCVQDGSKADTYHRNSLDEFLDERRLSVFHFRLPFRSGFSSSHLSSGEPMVTGDSDNTQSQNRLSWQINSKLLQIKSSLSLIKWVTSTIHLWNSYPDKRKSSFKMCNVITQLCSFKKELVIFSISLTLVCSH